METADTVYARLSAAGVLAGHEQDELKEKAAPPAGQDGMLAEVVYTPTSHLGLGFKAWEEMFAELWRSRELTWRLFLRDFSARYRQSLLGYIWAIVPALVTVATFTWLNRSKVLPIGGTDLPYPVYVLLAMNVWLLFANGLTAATQCLVTAGSLITKINFPRETLVLSAFGQSVFEFLVRSILVIGAFVIFHVVPAWTVVLVPLVVLPLCLFTIGFGYVASLVNAVFRDAGPMVTFLLTFWMFLTPVVYPAPTHGTHALINLLNPIAPFVTASVDLVSRGHITQPVPYAVACAVSLVVFALGWRVFHLTEPRIAERV